MAPPDPQADDTWVIFVRRWFGVTDSFPIHELANLLDDKIPDALDALARRWIAENHGSLKAWQAAWAKKEQNDRKSRQRRKAQIAASAMTLPGVRSPRSIANRKPLSRKELLQELKASALPLFDFVKVMARWAVINSGPRILIREGQREIPIEQVGAASSVCSRNRFLLRVEGEALAQAVTQRLARDYPRDEWGFLMYGQVLVDQLDQVQRIDMAQHLGGPGPSMRSSKTFGDMLASLRQLPLALQMLQPDDPQEEEVSQGDAVPNDRGKNTPFASEPARALRARSSAPPGWIYATDAQDKYKIKPSTFHGYRNRLGRTTPPDAVRDEVSGQVRVREAALRKLLGMPAED